MLLTVNNKHSIMNIGEIIDFVEIFAKKYSNKKLDANVFKREFSNFLNSKKENIEPIEKPNKSKKKYDLSKLHEQYKYLKEKVYENVSTSKSGTLNISTFYRKKVAKLLGGDYNELTKLQKSLLKSDIVDKIINIEYGISKYKLYR